MAKPRKSQSKTVRSLLKLSALIGVTLAVFALLIWGLRFSEHRASAPTLSPVATPASENDDVSSQVKAFYDEYVAIARKGLESGLNNTESGSRQLGDQLNNYVSAHPLASASLRANINRQANVNTVLCSQQYSLEPHVADRARITGNTATVLVHQRDGSNSDFETQIRVNLTRTNQTWLITSITCL